MAPCHAHLVRGELGVAREVLATTGATDGSDAAPHLVAAQIAWREDRVRDGTRHALDAAQVASEDADDLCTVSDVVLEVGETVAARACLDRVPLDACEAPLLLMRLAVLRKTLGQHVEALTLLDRAQTLGHASAAPRFQRGDALMFNGRIEEAEAELAASLAAAPTRGRVAVPLVRLRRQTADRNYLVALEAGTRAAAPATHDQAAFEFARYKTLEDLGRDDEAWQALVRGNALMHARLHDEVARHHAWIERYVSAWSSALPRASSSTSTGPIPIFIIGVARSGTTLLERMLGNHSQVAVAGELMDFGAQLHWAADTRNAQSDALVSRLPDLDYAELGRRYLAQTQWRARGKDFFVDKQPPNWLLAAAIRRSRRRPS